MKSIIGKWLLGITCLQLWVTSGKFSASANFNLFLDRREFQKLHGISSDIYYVLEGVVNEYALNFLVTVPPEVDDLHFSWQALTKRAVHYDMTMEYTDFFALLPPVSNITANGRVPHNLETFKVTLPCSGRSNAEVSVTIRMNFQVKHPKPNTTSINIKRNKICLFKEALAKPPPPDPPPPALPAESPPVGLETSPPHFPTATNSTLLFQDPTSSLLLAGLLGGCAMTASVVFLVFFICLRRKLSAAAPHPHQHYRTYGDPNSSSTNSSPACLLRQSQVPPNCNGDNHVWNQFDVEKSQPGIHGSGGGGVGGTISSRSGSQNSYVTIASFWNDIFSSSGPNNPRQVCSTTTTGFGRGFTTTTATNHSRESKCQSSKNSERGGGGGGSEVSPYAYAHIVPKLPASVPQPPKIGAPPPSLIEWYSQSPCQNIVLMNANKTENSFGHIYSNNMRTFNPQFSFSPKIVAVPEAGGCDHERSSTSSACSSSSENEPQPRQKICSPTAVAAAKRADFDRIVQVDGFQCCKDFDKESNVVERFL